MHKVNIIWRANLLVILIASHGFNIRIIDIFLKIIVETNYWLKTLIKLKACLHIKLSILHPISVKYQNIHVHIFSVSRNLVRKGHRDNPIEPLRHVYFSVISNGIPEIIRWIYEWNNWTHFFLFSFPLSCSLSSHKSSLLLSTVAWCRNRRWDSQTCCRLYLHSPTRFHLSSKQSYFTSKESDK